MDTTTTHPLDVLCSNSLGAGPSPMPPTLQLALEASFGSVERWRDGFVALGGSLGQSLGTRAGWVLMGWEANEGRLANQCVVAPGHAPDGGTPLLALGIHGQALPTEGAAAARAQAFLAQVDGAGLHMRYQQAVTQHSEPLGAAPDEAAQALLIDVRRAEAFVPAPTLIAQARWRDPRQVDAWASELPRAQAVVVYCVHGHEVSRATALRLRAAGLDARFLRGGIAAWEAAGLPLQPRTPGGTQAS
jgi:Fe-Mn family superoxide dismutase